jgi:hypothetical protein
VPPKDGRDVSASAIFDSWQPVAVSAVPNDLRGLSDLCCHHDRLGFVAERSPTARKRQSSSGRKQREGRSIVPTLWQAIVLPQSRTSTQTLNSMADLYPTDPVIVGSKCDNPCYAPPAMIHAATSDNESIAQWHSCSQ